MTYDGAALVVVTEAELSAADDGSPPLLGPASEPGAMRVDKCALGPLVRHDLPAAGLDPDAAMPFLHGPVVVLEQVLAD